MAKLTNLVEMMAWTLGEPEKSVHVRAMHLRKAKLLSSGGRGLHSADMKPSDATNLLLGCIHTGLAKDTADIVRRLRKARFAPWYREEPSEEKYPRPAVAGLMRLPMKHTLGRALDALFAEWASVHSIRHKDYDLTFSDVTLDLTTTAVVWKAWLSFFYLRIPGDPGVPTIDDFGAEQPTMEYFQTRPELDRAGRFSRRADEITSELLDKYGRKEVTVHVPLRSLKTIATCLVDDAAFEAVAKGMG